MQAGSVQSTHCGNDEEDDKGVCGTDGSSRSVHFYQYHIVYLPSYSVPVLLFKAHNEGKIELHVATTLPACCAC